jgi:ketosteroid isomerase-like protein
MTSICERLRDAQNAHDARRMAALFAEDYRSSQPVHPGREFTGRAQVLDNWTNVFAGVPDFRAVLVAAAAHGETEWGEWDWQGTHVDGSSFAMRGTTVLMLRDGLIAEARLYMEPVELVADDIDAAVQELYKPPTGSGSEAAE